MAKWLDVQSVKIDIAPTMEWNSKVDSETLASAYKTRLSRELISPMVKRYNIKEDEGIGFVVIYECFDKATNSVYEYGVFFDISTREILILDYEVKSINQSFAYMVDWHSASYAGLKALTNDYKARKK
jgi:hypothetical protein